MLTCTYDWKFTSADTSLEDSALLHHVRVLVTARPAPDNYLGLVSGQFEGEVELPLVVEGQTIIPLNQLDNDTLVQWTRAVNGPLNNDLWQAEAKRDMLIKAAATFRLVA